MSVKRSTPRAEPHRWEFKARCRRHAFGWKSQPAITRIKQALTEIKKVAKKELVVADGGWGQRSPSGPSAARSTTSSRLVRCWRPGKPAHAGSASVPGFLARKRTMADRQCPGTA